MARKSRYAAQEYAPEPAAVYNTAGYTRLSVMDKGENASLENQELLVRKYIEQNHDMKLKDVFSDNGLSGTTFERPGFDALMESIRRGEINCVIVKDLSRFGRDYIEAGNYIEIIFPRLGVRFISIGDNFDSFDPRCRSDGMSVALKNMINAFYAKDISRKIRSVCETKRNKGKFVGALPPFGFIKSPEDKHRLIIDPDAAAIVRDIFHWRVSGASAAEIVDRLNNMGIPAPTNYFYQKGISTDKSHAKPHPWVSLTVRMMLENIAYIGHMALGKKLTDPNIIRSRFNQPRDKWVITENTHEAIISKEDWELTQAVLTRDKARHWGYGKTPDERRADTPDNIFEGLIFCGVCGHVYGRKRNYNNDKRDFFYRCEYCGKNRPKGEKVKRISESELRAIVFTSVIKQVEVCANTRQLAAETRESATAASKKRGLEEEARRLKKQIDSFTAKEIRLYDDFCEGILSEGDYKLVREKYENENGEAVIRLNVINADLDGYKSEYMDNNQAVTAFERFTGVEALSRDMIIALVRRIEVDASRNVIIHFHFQDEYEKLEVFINKNRSVENG